MEGNSIRHAKEYDIEHAPESNRISIYRPPERGFPYVAR